MAESAVGIASTVSEVAGGTDRQLESLAGAKRDIGVVMSDVTRMSEKAEKVAQGSSASADAAARGETLMNEAMEKMSGIEQSVLHSANVVEKLGESSKQIGEISNPSPPSQSRSISSPSMQPSKQRVQARPDADLPSSQRK